MATAQSEPFQERPQFVASRGARSVGLAGFLVALVALGVVMFFLPPRARPWVALVVVLGAIVANDGAAAVRELSGRVYKP